MKRSLFIPLLAALLPCCQKEVQQPLASLDNPSSALLIFPYENSECNEGTNITPTESTVLFEWVPAENTDTYELILRNLNNSDQTNHLTSESTIPIQIMRATPYAWYIISRSNTTDSIAISETWKFYNAGDGIVSYAPFPAEIISPGMAEILASSSGEITLDWEGSDVDNDISGYDVYFGTTDPPVFYIGNVQESELSEVPVVSNSIYYWSVTTKDEHGNSSGSAIYQFKIL